MKKRKKGINRILSIVLSVAMVLQVGTGMTFATQTAKQPTIKIDSETIIPGGSGAGYSFSADGRTLTLDGLNAKYMLLQGNINVVLKNSSTIENMSLGASSGKNKLIEIFEGSNIVVSGNGELNLRRHFPAEKTHAIFVQMNSSFKLESGTINVYSEGDAQHSDFNEAFEFQTETAFNVSGGTINITGAGSGIKTDNTNVNISGGSINIETNAASASASSTFLNGTFKLSGNGKISSKEHINLSKVNTEISDGTINVQGVLTSINFESCTPLNIGENAVINTAAFVIYPGTTCTNKGKINAQAQFTIKSDDFKNDSTGVIKTEYFYTHNSAVNNGHIVIEKTYPRNESYIGGTFTNNGTFEFTNKRYVNNGGQKKYLSICNGKTFTNSSTGTVIINGGLNTSCTDFPTAGHIVNDGRFVLKPGISYDGNEVPGEIKLTDGGTFVNNGTIEHWNGVIPEEITGSGTITNVSFHNYTIFNDGATVNVIKDENVTKDKVRDKAPMSFTVDGGEHYTVTGVKYIVSGTEKTIEPVSGTYTIPAEDVTGDIEIVVSTKFTVEPAELEFDLGKGRIDITDTGFTQGILKKDFTGTYILGGQSSANDPAITVTNNSDETFILNLRLGGSAGYAQILGSVDVHAIKAPVVINIESAKGNNYIQSRYVPAFSNKGIYPLTVNLSVKEKTLNVGNKYEEEPTQYGENVSVYVDSATTAKETDVVIGSDFKVGTNNKNVTYIPKNITTPARITFNGNGGTGEMNPATCEKGETYRLPENQFTRNEYRFTGWNVSGTTGLKQAGDIITVSQDTVVTAQWEKISYCNITFKPGEGTGEETTVTHIKGNKYGLPACPYVQPMGKAFTGWQVAIGNGNATLHQPYERIHITENTVITPKFEKSDRIYGKIIKVIEVSDEAVAGYGAENIFDDDVNTKWMVDTPNAEPWIAIQLPSVAKLTSMSIKRGSTSHSVTLRKLKDRNAYEAAKDKKSFLADTNNWDLLAQIYSVDPTKKEFTTADKTDIYRIERFKMDPVTDLAEVEFTGEMLKANSWITEPGKRVGLTYDGTSHKLMTEGTATGGTVKYQLNGGEWTTTIPEAKDAGTYSVKVKAEADDVYAPIAEKEYQVTISPKRLTAADLSYTGKITKVYDKTNNCDLTEIAVKDTSLVAGDSKVSVTGTSSFDNADAGKNKKVTFIPSGTNNSNYTAEDIAEYEISNAEITKKLISTADVKFAGPQAGEKPVTEVAGTEFNTSITWSPSVTDKFDFNTTYKADVTLTPGSNYVFNSASVITGIDGAKVNTDGTVTGTKSYTATRFAKITGINAPKDTVLDKYCSSKEDVIKLLPAKLGITAENGVTSLNINWKCDGTYNNAPDAENNFKWTVNVSQLDTNGFATSGTIKVTNAAFIPVTITGTDKAVDYTKAPVDIKSLFTIDENAGTAEYTLETGGTGEGALNGTKLTVTKAGTFKLAVATAVNGAYGEGAATATLTVNKAVPEVTAPTEKELTFDNTEQALVNGGTVPEGAEMQYSLTKDSGYSTSIPVGKDAKEYTVWYKVIGGTNYNDVAAKSVKVTINQKDIAGATVNLDNSLTYTGDVLTQNVKSVEVDGLTVTYDVSGNKATNHGTYTLTVTGNGNFKGSTTKEFSIAKADAEYTAPVLKSSLKFNNAMQAIAVAGTTLHGEIQYRLGTDGTWKNTVPEAKDAGSYDVYYKLVPDGNHKAVAETKLGTVVIAPKDVTPAVTLGTETYVYNGKAKEPAVTVKDGTVVIPASEYKVTYADNTNVTTTAKVTVTDNAKGNYNITEVVKNFAITKSASQLKNIVIPETITYGDTFDVTFTPELLEEQGLLTRLLTATPAGETAELYLGSVKLDTVANVTEGNLITFTVNTTDKAINGTDFDGQKHEFKVKWGGDGNLKASEGTVEATLQKRVLTAAVKEGTAKDYDGNNTFADAELVLNNVNGKDKVTATADGTVANKNKGVQIVSATAVTLAGEHKDYYRLANSAVTGNFEIRPLEAELAWDKLVQNFTGSELKPVATVSNMVTGDNVKVTVEGAQTNAGKYTATATALSDSNYKLPAAATKGFEIKAIDPEVTAPTAEKLTFDNTEQALVNGGTVPAGAEMQYSLTKDSGYSTSIPVGKDAKEYTVWYKVVGGTNYNDVAAQSVKVTINQKDIAKAVITLDGDLTYTGSKLTQNIKSVVVDGLTVTYAVTDNTATDYGTYTLTVTGTGNFKGTATQDFSVAKAESSITEAPVPEDLTYTGINQKLVKDGTASGGDMVYSLTEKGEFTTSIPEGKDAAHYTVYYKVAGDKNHNDSAVKSVAVTIKQAPLKITAEDKTVKYGAAVPEYTVKYDGFVNKEDAAVLDGKLSYDCEYTNKSDVGSYAITPSGLTSDNYKITYVNGNVKVEKADADVTAPAANKLTYNGEVQELVTAGTVPAGAEMQYSLSETDGFTTDIPTGKDQGEYTVWYKVAGGKNYVDQDAKSVTVNIAKKNIKDAVITLDNSLTYTGNELTQNVKDVVVDSLSATCDVTENTATNAGKYTLTVTGNGNFTGTATKEFTIAKAEPLASMFTAGNLEVTYDGKTHKPEVNVNEDILGMGEVTVTTEAAKVADSAEQITFSVAEGDNYLAGDLTLDTAFTVNAKPLTIKAAVADKAWDGKKDAEIVSAELEGVVEGDDVKPAGGKAEFTSETEGKDIPVIISEYTLEGKDAGNYTVSMPEDVKAEITHNFGEPEFTFSEDGKEATAKRICKGNKEHVETAEAVVTSEVKKPATLEAMGVTLYTATVKFGEEEFTATKEVTDIPKVKPASTVEKIVQQKLDKVPEGLLNTKFNTIAKIENALKKSAERVALNELGVTTSDDIKTIIFDAVLMITENGVSRPATKEEIEARGGITVVIPYPEGTNKDDYYFVVSHMLTVAMNGMEAGDIETPEITFTEDGLKVTLKGLSPVMVAYAEKPEEKSAKTGDDNNMIPWMMGLAVALTGTGFVVVRKKENE